MHGIKNDVRKYTIHSGILEHWKSQKSVSNIWQRFSCLLDEWIEKICKNFCFTVAFFKIHFKRWNASIFYMTAQKYFQIYLACPCAFKTDKVDLMIYKKATMKKKKNLHIFSIHTTSRHEKHCQMLETLFWLFQCSKNPRWYVYS